MLNTTETETRQANFEAVSDAKRHLQQHGTSLCELLDAIDDPSGTDPLCDLHMAFEKPFPDAADVGVALRRIERFLACQTPSSLDRLGRERNFYAADAARWHGARVSELAARFLHIG